MLGWVGLGGVEDMRALSSQYPGNPATPRCRRQRATQGGDNVEVKTTCELIRADSKECLILYSVLKTGVEGVLVIYI